MRHDRLCPVLVAAIVLGAAGAVLYTFASAATWWGVDPQAKAIEAAAGTLAGVLAGICWSTVRREAAERRRERDEQDKSDLIRTLAALAPDEPGNPGRAAGLRRVR